MHAETNERIQRVQAKIQVVRAIVAELEARATGSFSKEQVQHVVNELDDVEVLYLGSVRQKRTPPQTLSEELRGIELAEFFLVNIVLPQVVQLRG